MFTDPRIGQNENVLTTSLMDRAHGRSGLHVLINGALNPQIFAISSQAERWRLINAFPSRCMDIRVESAEFLLISTRKGRHRIYDGDAVIGEVLASIYATNLLAKATLGSIPLLKADKVCTIKILGAGMMGIVRVA